VPADRSLEGSIQQEVNLSNGRVAQWLTFVGPAATIATMGRIRVVMLDVRSSIAMIAAPTELGVERIQDVRF
jgi:hypothetical protein